MELQPILREKPLRDSISDALRLWIVSGHLKPGQRLIEQELCEELEVSRTALREAFPRLEVECLVVNRREGRSVAEVRQEHMKPLRDTCIAISSLVIQGFCENAERADRRELRRTIVPERGAGCHFKQEERAFFHVLGQHCGNRFAAEAGRQLEDRREMMERFLCLEGDQLRERRAHLNSLLAALEQRDAKKAIVRHSNFLTVLFERLEASLRRRHATQKTIGVRQAEASQSSFQRFTIGR